MNGVIINSIFLGIDNSNIQEYYKLCIVQFVGTLIPMLYMYCIIPTNENIDMVQAIHNSVHPDILHSKLLSDEPEEISSSDKMK